LTSFVILALIVQMMVTTKYNVSFLTSVVIVCYSFALTMMAILAQKFLSWYNSRPNLTLMLFGLSSAVIFINLSMSLILVGYALVMKPTMVTPHVGSVFMTVPKESILYWIKNCYEISSILSFVMMWFSTCTLLHHHSTHIGRLKFWLIVSLPLIVFLSQFTDLFTLLPSDVIRSNSVLYSIIFGLLFTYSKPVGGILFGISFWIITHSVKESKIIRIYLTLSAYGIVLFFIANNAIVITSTPYPPFGIISTSLEGLASYLIFTGIYYSTLSLSVDNELERSIRRFASAESRFFHTMGRAEFVNRVWKFSRVVLEKTKEEVGVESSYDETSVLEYVDQVIDELKNKKSKDT